MTQDTDLKMTQDSDLKMNSILYWLSALIAIAIIVIGLRGLIYPEAAAEGYGIPVGESSALAFLQAKGIRDIVSGLFVVAFLALKMRKALAMTIAIAVLIPAVDFLIVYANAEARNLVTLLIHGGTALYMAIVAFLLFKSKF